MQPSDPIDDFVTQASDVLPADLNILRAELETNLKQGLQHLLNRLSLVSRDEFEIQSHVLQRTQEKLVALESKILALEEKYL